MFGRVYRVGEESRDKERPRPAKHSRSKIPCTVERENEKDAALLNHPYHSYGPTVVKFALNAANRVNVE